MFAGFGVSFLKKRLFAGSKGEVPKKDAAVKVIDVQLASQKTPPDAAAAAKVIDNEAIAKRALEIWEREGRPQGKDLEHWLAAESELKAVNAS